MAALALMLLLSQLFTPPCLGCYRQCLNLVWRLLAILIAADGPILRGAFLETPVAAVTVLEAAVRAAYCQPVPTFRIVAAAALATSNQAASEALKAAAVANGCRVLLGGTLALCALAVLEDPDDLEDQRQQLLVGFEQQENRSMLHAAQQVLRAAQTQGLGPLSVAAVVAAANAAAMEAADVVQQERLQLLLRVVSLLGSCVKAIAVAQQQKMITWGCAASHCGLIVDLCQEIARYERELSSTQRQSAAQEAESELWDKLDVWCEVNCEELLSDECAAVVWGLLGQYPYCRQLLLDADVEWLQGWLQQHSGSQAEAVEGVADGTAAETAVGADNDGSSDEGTAAAAAVQALLAALLLGQPGGQQDGAMVNATGSSVTSTRNDVQAGSSSSSSGEQPTGSTAGSSSINRKVLTAIDVKLARIAGNAGLQYIAARGTQPPVPAAESQQCRAAQGGCHTASSAAEPVRRYWGASAAA
jgi:hypothetical protein